MPCVGGRWGSEVGRGEHWKRSQDPAAAVIARVYLALKCPVHERQRRRGILFHDAMRNGTLYNIHTYIIQSSVLLWSRHSWNDFFRYFHIELLLIGMFFPKSLNAYLYSISSKSLAARIDHRLFVCNRSNVQAGDYNDSIV